MYAKGLQNLVDEIRYKKVISPSKSKPTHVNDCMVIHTFVGVLANEANITLIDFPEGFYFDWPQPNVTISHRAATSWKRQQLQNEWNKMVHNGIEIMKKNFMPP